VCAYSSEGQPYAGLHQKKCGQQVEGGDSSRLFLSGETSVLRFWSPVSTHGSPQHRKDTDLLEQVRRRATKMIRGMEHLSYEERLRSWGCSAWRREDPEETLLWPSSA